MKTQLSLLQKGISEAVSHLSNTDIAERLPYIELALCDYEFFEENPAELFDQTPADALLARSHQESPEEISEQLALLAVYLANRMESENRSNDIRLLNYANQALNLSRHYRERAEKQKTEIQEVLAESQREKNSKTNELLNDKKYRRNRSLRDRALQLYPQACEELRQNGKRITYDSIAVHMWPTVEPHNQLPDGTPIIGRHGDPHAQLVKWFQKAVRDKQIPSPRKLK